MTSPARTVEEAVAWLMDGTCDGLRHAMPGYLRECCRDCIAAALREQREAGERRGEERVRKILRPYIRQDAFGSGPNAVLRWGLLGDGEPPKDTP